MIRAFHHAELTVPIGAEDEARRFYCGALGLREIPKPPALAVRGGFWLELGAVQVHIGVEDGVERRRTKAHVAFEVDDIAEARARLTALGVHTKDGVPIPDLTRFECRDPFGNRLEFLQRIDGGRR